MMIEQNKTLSWLSRRNMLKLVGGGLAVGVTAACGRDETPAAGTPQATVPVAAPDKKTFYMFVQNAKSGSFKPNPAAAGLYTLVLEGVGGDTIYFSDRPERDAGRMAMQPFLTTLGFSSKNPPNAALVVAGQDGSEVTAVIELFSPRYDGAAQRLTYDARIVPQSSRPGLAVFANRKSAAAAVPEQLGETALFVDDCAYALADCFGPNGDCGGLQLAQSWKFIVGCTNEFDHSYYVSQCNSNYSACCAGKCTVNSGQP